MLRQISTRLVNLNHVGRYLPASFIQCSFSYYRQSSTVSENTQDQFNFIRKTVKPLNSRKTYLVDAYSHILKTSPVVLVVHHNNLLKSDDHNLRSQIKKAGGELTISRARLLKVALRGIDHKDPASKEAQKIYKTKRHPIFPLLNGPIGIISFSELNPQAVDQAVRVLEKSKGSLILLGAMVDKKVLSVVDINSFKMLPTLPEIRSQLVGVLSILGGAGLVQTLEASSKLVYLTIEERKKQLDNSTELELSDSN